MKWLAKLLSAYLTDYPKKLAYMWQASEYRSRSFIRWWWRLNDFRNFNRRGELIPTLPAKIVRLIIVMTSLTYFILNVLSIIEFIPLLWVKIAVGMVSLVAYPFIVVILSIPLIWTLGLINQIKNRAMINQSAKIFASYGGKKIAIVGSYGKTSMKELLNHVIGSFRLVLSTAGNANTITSVVKFAANTSGNEDILIIEMGEESPGDLARLAQLVKPDHVIITGLAPNHLEHYKTLDSLVNDFKAVAKYVEPKNLFINADNSELVRLFPEATTYSRTGVDDLKVSQVRVNINSLNFKLVDKNKKAVNVFSNLIGQHNIGPVSLAYYLARSFGARNQDIVRSIEQLFPYDHRLQPRVFHGGWLIDDTYNGSIEGLRAGLEYLKTVETTGRKIYVTPGLVDQGVMTAKVHEQLGQLIAEANPDKVYLMQNSVTEIINSSLTASGYKGIIEIVEDPLSFYEGLEHLAASGDIILCQNDWTDFYN